MGEALRRALCFAMPALALATASVAFADPCAIPTDGMGALAAVDLSRDGGTGFEAGIGGTGLREGGIGGTGLQGDDNGVGGTGLQGDDSGIGGTGLAEDSGIGGTGIFGTVTAFGSVCVNGLRVHYPDDAAVWVNGRAADPSALGVGQVVWILATTRDGRLETNRIAVYSAVAGRIEAVDAASRRLRVAGRDVHVPDGARVQGAGGRRGFASLTRGQNIDVSGLLDARGAVIASRVVVVSEVPRADIAPTRVGDLIAASSGIERLSIEGYVDRRIRADRILVGGLEIDLSGRPAQVGRIDRGARVLATGYIAPDGSLRVTRALIRPPVPKRPLEAPGDSSRGSEDAGVTPIERATVPTDVESPIRLDQEIPVRVDRLDLPDRPTLQRIDRPKPIERIDRPDRIDR